MALYFILLGIYKARSVKTLGVMVPRAALGVRVPRAALGVRVPRAHARRVANPSDRIDLNQGVRVPRPVPITRIIIFTMNESMGMKVTFGSSSTPNHQYFFYCNKLTNNNNSCSNAKAIMLYIFML